jgi:hypothetical protein
MIAKNNITISMTHTNVWGSIPNVASIVDVTALIGVDVSMVATADGSVMIISLNL